MRQWQAVPPAHIQLAQIGAFLGIKAPEKNAGTPIKPPEKQDTEELFSLFPTGKMPKILSAEEYLERKSTHEQQ